MPLPTGPLPTGRQASAKSARLETEGGGGFRKGFKYA
jgi:hypothetical protein